MQTTPQQRIAIENQQQAAFYAANPKAAQLLQSIAASHLRLETLEARNSDELDFQDQAVWQIEKALRAAFLAGQQSVK